ncbi:MAG: hypothetical protein FWD76_02430 [Firmicutes bacterium]|nr:hypothetical protein [Bacillota bacterium]
MNESLANAIITYATKEHAEFSALLANKSKEDIAACLVDLLTTYINDKNSSTLREFITVTICGYQHHEGKLGYNGYRQSTIVGGDYEYCEVKPKNFDTNELKNFAEGKRKNKPSKLSGNGNFTDYCHKRIDKNKKDNPKMLVSGFVDGRLLYCLEFDFNTPSFVEKLQKMVDIRFPSGDVAGQYIRSLAFDYRDYIDSATIKIFVTKEQLLSYKDFIQKDFFDKLCEVSK